LPRISSLFALIVLFAALMLAACSTQKNTVVSRAYHNLTSRYNVYFNGNEAMKSGLKKINNTWADNYSLVLPPFKWTDPKINRTASGDMEKALKKGSKLIKLHSITAKPKRKKGKMSASQKEFYKKNEYNNWVDDAYLMIGKGHFFRSDFYSAAETFEFVIKQFNEQPIKYDGMLWLSRTFNEQKKYDKSRELLDLIENDKKLPKRLKPELAITYADYFLKQGYYNESVPYLEQSIKITRKKALRNRYKFILAQIYQKNNDIARSSKLFTEVIKSNTSYELTFNARLARAGLYSSEQGGGKEFMKELSRMLKDDKNKEYRDQIYFVLGNIALKDRDTTEALDNFKLSAEVSVNNVSQKAMSFLAAANIYFVRPDYRNAQAFYDSTLFFLDDKYPDYLAISQKSANLNRLIENISIVEAQDSLQRVAGMSESDRNKFIDGLIEKVKKEEEKQKELERQTQQNFMSQKQQQYDPRYQNMMSGKWYFYNPTALSFGQSEFAKVWGRRKLEDNWRRKNKMVVAFSDGEEEEEEGEVKKKPTDNKSREFYMVDLPLTDSLLKASTNKIIDAYFVIGDCYKNDFEDYPNSIKAYTRLNERFPQNVYLLHVYYSLYKLYRIMGDESRADEFKNMIITKFPNSKYARMFTNPNYLSELEAEQNKVKELYGDAYSAYKKKSYSQSLQTIEQIEKQYPDNDLQAKLLLLKALATGETGKTDEMVPILKDVVKKYPDTEEKNSAKDILALLKKGGTEIGSDLKMDDEQEAEKAAPLAEIYEMDEKTVHYYLVVAETKAVDINRLKFNVSNFNVEKFASFNFNVSSVVLNDNFQIITVKSFPTSRKAMEYFKEIKDNPEVFRDVKAGAAFQFVISMNNFATFFKNQDIERYQVYFEKNYRSSK
jgi:tetratricopeptide (TPR) repeat protein